MSFKHQNPTAVADLARLVEALLETVGPALDTATRIRLRTRFRTGAARHCSGSDPTIAALCIAYLRHAQIYYRCRDGVSTTTEAEKCRYAFKPLRRLFGRVRVSRFGPRRLRDVRDEMIRIGWCRSEVNRQTGRIKRMFKWATGQEMIAPAICQALNAVEGLRVGRTQARESPAVRPAMDHLIEGALFHVCPQVRAMIQLQLLTGMRPGEVVIMRACDIEMDGDVWLYRPEHHKTEHLNHERSILLGPKARLIIEPFLRREEQKRYIFSPREADRERRHTLHAARRTPLSCGNRPGTNRKRKPRKQPGERYCTNSYQHAVKCACLKAFPPPEGLDNSQEREWRRKHHWHPHQLRHNAATRLRRQHGLDVAQVVLGHRTLAVTQVYTEKDVETAKRIMRVDG